MATTSLSFHIFARYHGSPAFRRARRDLADVNSQFHQSVLRANQLAKQLHLVATAAIALGPALIPIGAHLLAIGAGFVAVSAAAIAAGGIWAAVLKSAMDKSKEWDAATGRLTSTWDKFVQRMSPTVLQPALTVVGALTNSIHKLEPVVRAVTPVANEVANAFKRWTTNGGLDRFIALLVQFGVPALRSFKNIAIDLLAVLGFGFRAFLPTGMSVVQTLERGAQALRNWAAGGGFQRFLQYVKENSPQVREFFSQLWIALGRIGTVLVSVAPLSLLLATGLLRMINAIPLPVLTALIQAFVLWRAAMLGLFIIQTLITVVKAFIVVIKALRVAWFILSIAFAASPLGWLVIAIGAVVAAIVFMAVKTTWLQTAWKYSWNAIKVAAAAVWGFLKAGLRVLWTILKNTPLFLLIRNWRTVWNGIKAVSSAVWNFLRNVIFNPLKNFFTKIIPSAAGVFKRGIVGAFNSVRDGVGAAWRFIKGIIDKIVGGLKRAGKAIKDLVSKIPGGGVLKKVGGFLGKLNPFASGGAVQGPGTGTSDSILARLSNGEHVWTAREVASFGGHGAVKQMRQMALGRIKKFADGGPVGGGGGGGVPAASMGPAPAAVKQAKASTNDAIQNIVAPVASLFSRTIPAAAGAMQAGVGSRWTQMKGTITSQAQGVAQASSKLVKSWADLGRSAGSSAKAAGDASSKVGGAWRNMRGAVASNLQGMTRQAFGPMNTWQRSTLPRAADAMSGAVRGRWNQTRAGVANAHNAMNRQVYQPTRNMYTRSVPSWSASMRNGVTRSFGQMRDGVRRTWDGIKNATKNPVNWVIRNTYGAGIRRLWNAVSNVIFGAGKRQLPAVRGLATGGPVNGPGGPTSDKIPAMLSAGEHVITAREVAAMGGHRMVAQARSRALGGRAVRTMGTTHFAEGGGTGGSTNDLVRGNLTSFVGPRIDGLRKAMAKTIGSGIPFKAMVSDAMNTKMQDILDKVMQDDAENMFNGFQPFRPWQAGDGRKVGFRGKTFNVRTRQMLQKAEKMAKKAFSIFQGSYSNAAASAGTHSGGGAVDLGPSIDANVGFLRSSGFAAWRRTPKEGFSNHIHGIAVGDPTVSPGAAAQVRAFFAGRNGLANNGPDTYMPGGGGGAGAARWAGLVRSVLAELGQSPSHLANVLKAIAKESGGNPRAVNNWDSNARAGTPSGGLLQTIGPTFNAYAGKYRSLGMFNPKANIYAAIRYAMARYGGGWSARMARPGGYAMGGGVPFAGTFDNGGMLPKGLSMVNNATGKPERLLNADQGGGGHLHIHGNVYVKSEREFQEMVAEAYTELKRRGRT